MDIKQIVIELIRKYETRCPFEIAKALGIHILYEDLGTINGYYNKTYRIKFIHINQNLDESAMIRTCSHELGHAVLHQDMNTNFLKMNTFFSTDKIEIEANKFMAELLIADDLIADNPYLTKQQIACLAGYDDKIIDFKQIDNSNGRFFRG